MSITNIVLKDQNEQEVPLTGKGKILLSFHPLAWTSVCSRQMQDLEGCFDELKARGITPYGLSVDAQPCKKAWGESLGIKKLQILADFWPHGQLAEALGCLIPKAGISGRSHFLLDNEGKVLWSKRHEISEQPDFKVILAELAAQGNAP